MISRPPMLQTHSATLGHRVGSREGGRDRKKRKVFVSATWICPRALWVITEQHGSSTSSASLEATQQQSEDTDPLLLCHYVS